MSFFSLRNFEADSIKCVKEKDCRGVTLVLGKKRIRGLLYDKTNINPDERDALHVIAVLFDRVYFCENDSKVWWEKNKERLM